MSESARARVRGTVGGIVVGIVLVTTGATSADSGFGATAVVLFCGACGFVFSPRLNQDEMVDF